MGKLIEQIPTIPTLGLRQEADGFWLWDETRGMNLAVKKRTERDAFVRALQYYQVRTKQVEAELAALRNVVENFTRQVPADLLPQQRCDCDN